MYKVAVERKLQKLHRGSLKDWIGTGGEDNRTPQQEHDDLVKAIHRIERDLANRPSPDMRKRLGQEKFKIQERLKELAGARPRKLKSQSSYFVRVASELLDKATFDQIRAEADRRFQADAA